MGYKFRYESLLKYRSFLKDMAEMEFSRAVAHNQELNRKKKIVLSAIERTLSEAIQLLKKGVSAGKYQQMIAYVERLKERLKMLEMEIEKSNREVELAREKLVDKMVDVKVLEKLSRKDFMEYKKRMAKREMKLNDELYLIRFDKA